MRSLSSVVRRQIPVFGLALGTALLVLPPFSALLGGSAGATVPGQLPVGQTLSSGQSVASPNGSYTLLLETSGDLVVDQGSTQIWDTNTAGNPNDYLILQTDGNLVLYSSGASQLWASSTAGTVASYLAMQNDGNLVIYGPSGATWNREAGALLASAIGSTTSYQANELFGGGATQEGCSVCSPSGILSESGGASTKPNQPVGTVLGDFTTAMTLFDVPAVDGSLSLTLTYDSGLAEQEEQDSVFPYGFGYGWQSNLSNGVSVVGNDVYIDDANTTQVLFTVDPGGGTCPSGDDSSYLKYTVTGSSTDYCAARRVDAQLLYSSIYGAYQVNTAGGLTTEDFNVYGQLVYQGNLANTSAIAWNEDESPGSGQCPSSWGGTCWAITDSAGRSMTAEFGYGLVGAVLDPLGRTYSMAYNTTGSNVQLTSVSKPPPWNSPTTPVSLTLNYSYAASPYSAELTSIQPPGLSESIAYGSSGMVSTLTDGLGQNTTAYSYSDTTCATVSETCSSGTQTTTVTYPDGEVDVDSYNNSMLVNDQFGASATQGAADTEDWYFGYVWPIGSNQDTSIDEDIAGPSGLTSVITSDEAGGITAYTDPNGNVTTAMYNDAGANNLPEVCWLALPGVSTGGASCGSPPTGSTSFTYDSLGDVLSQTDPLGNVTHSAYSTTTGLICWSAPPTVTTSSTSCSTVPTGATTFAYDSEGNVNSETVASGTSVASTTTTEYDADDELLYSIPPDGQGHGAFGSNAYETAYTYFPDGSLDTTTDPGTRITTDSYFDNGLVSTVEIPKATTTDYYDQDGRLCWTLVSTSASSNSGCSSPPAGSTLYSYLADTGSPSAVTDPDGNVTSLSYADKRFPTQATESAAPTVGSVPAVTYSSFDAFGNACLSGPVSTGTVGSCSYVSGDTSDTYNTEGQLSSWEDPSGLVTTYGYSDAAYPVSPTSATNPLNKVTTSSYDADGHLTQSEDPEANFVSMGYDADGRLCYRAPVQSSAACGSGQPTGTGVTAYSYDAAGRRSSMVDNSGAPSGQVTDNYSYDASGNLLSEGEDSGTTTSFSYDKNNEVNCVTYPAISGSTCSKSPSSSNSVVDYGYNKAGEVNSITDWVGNTITPSNYNALGEVGKITYLAIAGYTLSYSYDAAGNLTAATYGGTLFSGLGSDSWTPNADTKTAASAAVSSFSSPSDLYDTYGRSSQATNPTSSGSQSGPDAYLYNANGELASDTPPGTGSQALTYTYNGGAELTSIDNPNNPAATQYESLGYNSDGQRCGEYQSSSANNAVNCGSLPSGSTGFGWNTYGELCWVGTTTNANVGCGSAPSGSTMMKYDGNGLLTGASTPSTSLSFTWDTHASTPLMLSDGTNSYVYGPLLFGGTVPLEEIANNTTSDYIAPTPSGVQAVFSLGVLREVAAYSLFGTQVVQSGSAVTPFGFDGSYQIAGLNYLVSRYYDPSTSQFLSVDPANTLTGEPYAFAQDDPLNATDPSGQMIETVSTDGQICNGQAVNPACGITAPVAVEGVTPGTIAPVNNPTASFLTWVSTQPLAVQQYFQALHAQAVQDAILAVDLPFLADLAILAAAGWTSAGPPVTPMPANPAATATLTSVSLTPSGPTMLQIIAAKGGKGGSQGKKGTSAVRRLVGVCLAALLALAQCTHGNGPDPGPPTPVEPKGGWPFPKIMFVE
jgi:RHS repeat-associated protein